MPIIEKSIEVNVPAQVAYDQWTQFEDFPLFMDGIVEVTQLDDTHLHWKADVAGQRKEWDAEITEQIPGKRIAWRSISGARNAGVVTFHHLDASTSRIMLQMDYDPEGLLENAGDALGVLTHRVNGDLERFKEFIESRGAATGAWRGQVDADSQQGSIQRH
ncbi:SRPBCC family protein [Methylobacillus flagellatus]|uniref:Cyclase/dehydrase n=1 Tax=Methylobacillus flagellatus (strain ATCC 51484 / DSM 6875 / VKM B-1610 / KT) TaxID=265072 RepID=Q1GXK4_METFK|nr:SRPBCC family protein [Methylobacillus flagellatus]ABE48278.1 cyclase/dehydrase [Methylobacillus flagellatus KT]